MSDPSGLSHTFRTGSEIKNFMRIKNKIKFCPACGNQLKFSKSERLIDCLNCGFYFYLSPSVTVAILFKNKEGRFLFVRRKIPPKKGFWDLPGGFVDYQEGLDSALIREVKEETGVKLEKFDYFGSETDDYYFRGINYYAVVAFYTGYIDQEIKAGDDVDSYRYFEKENIPFSGFAFPGLAKLIKKYLSIKTT